MISAQQIVLVCWGIFLVYWFISAWSVKPTQQVKWGFGNFRWIILILLAVFLILRSQGLGLTLPRLSFAQVSPMDPLGLASVAVTVAGLGVAVYARRTLAANWSNIVELKQGHELITTGPYAYVRHPIYSGMLLMLSGTILSIGILRGSIGLLGALVGLVIVAPVLLFKMNQEEALMGEHFADEYAAYKKCVKALIPFVW